MSSEPAQQIADGLQAVHTALQAGDLARMHDALVATLDVLAQVTRDGLVPRLQRPQPRWDAARGTRLLWNLLARCHAADCHVFPYAGTLLGLERDGALLPDDKDADLAVWLEDFALAGRLLQQWGLARATDVPPFGNMATFVDRDSGCSFDLFGLRRAPEGTHVEGGVWLYGRPASHQRLLRLPWFTLAARGGPAGTVWWPAPAGDLLAALYGDWRTPQPEWDAQISNPSVQALNLNWRCWALKSLCQCWLTGDLPRTARRIGQIAGRAGEDAQLRRWADALAAHAGPDPQ
jgi:hypothetical protein